jgi:hypothetical protein
MRQTIKDTSPPMIRLIKVFRPKSPHMLCRRHIKGLARLCTHRNGERFPTRLKIGIDGFAHAPYYGWNGKLESKPQDDLTVKDIKLAARKNIVVIPTAQRSIYSATDYTSDGKGTLNRERFQRIVERQKKLFNAMNKTA